jgi:DUF4097 and DUF4098 domain-containing protein YvlB
MSHVDSRSILRTAVAAAFLAAPAVPATAAERRPIDEHRAADAQGQVEVSDVSGRISVLGWDKAEVAVTGSASANVDRVDIESSGKRTTVRVVLKEGQKSHWEWSGKDGDSDLTVHVPRASSLSVSLVSADLSVSDVQGNQEIVTTSGDVHSTAARELRVRSVSGDLQLTAGADSKVIEVNTVSGDVHLTGGGGDVSVQTVSGDGLLSLGTASRARLKSVSGDFSLTTGLAPDGRLEAESISGDFKVHFTGGVPPAEFDLQSFSGDLTTCFGGQATHERFGPGSRLSYKEGAGTARVRIDTKSGDVSLCTKR